MPAPPEAEIRKIFEPLSRQGFQDEFFEHVADDVDWEIIGHIPFSNHYSSKKDFVASPYSALVNKVLTAPPLAEVVRVVVGGDIAAVEMRAFNTKCRSGKCLLAI